MIIKETAEEEIVLLLSYEYIYFTSFFEGRYEAINSEVGFLSFTATLPYFSLSLETSPEKIK